MSRRRSRLQELLREKNIVFNSPIDRLVPTDTLFSASFFSPYQLALETGISLRTQELYTLVFVCRYLDLFTR